MNKEFIAYQGEKFTIEWYYDDKGISQAIEYFEELKKIQKAKLMTLFKKMADIGEIRDMEKFRYEGDKIYAFKTKPDRFLCFFIKGKKIIVTNAFHKKTNKLPIVEKEKALKCKNNYEERLKNGVYYG